MTSPEIFDTSAEVWSTADPVTRIGRGVLADPGLVVVWQLESDEVAEEESLRVDLRSGGSEESIRGSAAIGTVDGRRVVAVVLDRESSLTVSHPLPDELYSDDVPHEAKMTAVNTYFRNPSAGAGSAPTPRNRNPLCSIWRRFCDRPG